MLNESKGNMYGMVTHTWNPVKGKCPHGCHYCYMTRFGTPQKPPRLVEKELKQDLGAGNFIFVGSSFDLFAGGIPAEWVTRTLEHCRKYDGNRYLFQTKNPSVVYHMGYSLFPTDFIFGTTIETNRRYPEMGVTINPQHRAIWLKMAKNRYGCRIMITIEPVMDFDLHEMNIIIKKARPDIIHIGANTNPKVKVPEPDKAKLLDLIEAARELTDVRLKTNLKRLLGEDMPDATTRI